MWHTVNCHLFLTNSAVVSQNENELYFIKKRIIKIAVQVFEKQISRRTFTEIKSKNPTELNQNMEIKTCPVKQ